MVTVIASEMRVRYAPVIPRGEGWGRLMSGREVPRVALGRQPSTRTPTPPTSFHGSRIAPYSPGGGLPESPARATRPSPPQPPAERRRRVGSPQVIGTATTPTGGRPVVRPGLFGAVLGRGEATRAALGPSGLVLIHDATSAHAFRFPLQVPGRMVVNTDGSATVLDAYGRPLHRVGHPRAFDAGAAGVVHGGRSVRGSDPTYCSRP